MEGLTHKHSDVANAELLVAWFGSEFRYVSTWGKFIAWDGRRWVLESADAMVTRHAIETARRMLAIALDEYAAAARAVQDAGGDSADDALKKRAAAALAAVKHAQKAQAARSLAAMMALAKCMPAVTIAHTALDADVWKLNAANGTIDLQTGELHPHTPADLITKIAPVEYDPGAAAPTWEAFVARAMGGNDDLVAYLRRIIGYSLTGSTREHVLGFNFGGGANGKSTFLGTVHRTLGDYSAPAPRGLLFASKNTAHPTELASLYGARFVMCPEIEEGKAFDEAKVKDLTGGDPIRARRMNEDFWTFIPTHTLFLAGNHKPVVRGTDDGIWRRMRLVPWVVTIPESERDPRLPEKLAAELPGILAWAVRGCLEWQRSGLAEPDAVKSATDAYRDESDPVAEFFSLRCVFSSDATVTRKMLRAQYVEWSEENGVRHPLDAKAFAAALRARGVVDASVRDAGQPRDGWRGVRLATEKERESGLQMLRGAA